MATKNQSAQDALRHILAQAKKYAKSGNGQSIVFWRMAAKALGVKGPPARERGKRKRAVMRGDQLAMF